METILIKKIGRKNGISVYKKALISEHRNNYIFRDDNCFVKMSVCLLVTNFCGLRADEILVHIDPKLRGRKG